MDRYRTMISHKTISIEKLLMILAFGFYFIITCYKLTNAPLWFDETIEYWYSKVLIGKIPFNGNNAIETTNMYQRIISTYQPPLYNFIMYFWLKISSTEFWFRFFGVLMGFIGNAAIYKTVKKIGNGYIAALAVFFTTCTVRLVYYWQECAEYCLMLGTLCWTIYFFISFIKDQSLQNIIGLTIFSVIPVYSQYGAVFPVFPMLLTAYIYALIKKNKNSIVNISISYVVAFLTTALPLIFFFLIKQMESQHEGQIITNKLEFEINIVFDIIKSFEYVVFYNLFRSTAAAWLFVTVFIICEIVVLVFSKEEYAKCLVIVNIAAYIFYYFAVKVNLYSYGAFDHHRYSMFFVLLWIVSSFCFGIEITHLVQLRFIKFKNIGRINFVIAAFAVICYMILNWNLVLKYNWTKEDMRGAVDKWIEQEVYDSNTIVYYAGDSAFSYYLRQTENYSPDMEYNVHYMDFYRDKTVQEYSAYVDSLYGKVWPEEVYIIGSHIRNDMDALVKAFTNKGYNIEEVFNHEDGILMRMILE